VTIPCLLLCSIFVIWLTYALLPEGRKEWVLAPVGLTLTVVAIGVIVFEAFSSWILLSAITQRPVECALAVIALHMVIGITIWRSR
jgi:hypothetical protein